MFGKLEEMQVSKSGTIKIVSSGYEDRYPLCRTWMNIRCGLVTFRVDFSDQYVPALLKLAGLELTDENYKKAAKIVNDVKYELWFTIREKDSATAFITTSEKLRAGIAVATGFPHLNDYGICEAKEVAQTLTKDDWKAVKFGLEEVNEEAQKNGRPVVDFSIPSEVL